MLLLAGGLFYFDGWLWGDRKMSGDRIGTMVSRSGDVRMKFKGDLKWQKAARGQDLIYNDSVYAGAGAKAQLKLGDSDMTITENTLVVLRRQNDVNFLNLDYGTLFSKVGKNDKIVIEDSDGKKIELSSNDKAQFVLKKSNGKTELNVVSGEAQVQINGKMQKLNKNSRLVVDEKQKTAKVEDVSLKLARVHGGEPIYSDKATSLPFAWAWSDGRPVKAGERFNVEFSAQPSFSKIHATKPVTGQLGTTMSVSQSLQLFYRVRGPSGEFSPVDRVNFVRMHSPVIVKPVADQRFPANLGDGGAVDLEFQKPGGGDIWYQLAKDPEFQQIVLNKNGSDLTAMHELPIGPYYIRARGDYGQGHQTEWTPSVPFQVERKIQEMKLSDMPARRSVVIPNRDYPPELYKAEPTAVRTYLSKTGFLKQYFPFPKDSFDEISVEVKGDKQPVAQKHAGWPGRHLQPGRYDYKYEVRKEGHTPVASQSAKRLDISMEPPRPVGEPGFSKPNRAGEVYAAWKFTPILFAKSYDLELSRDPSFQNAQTWQSDSNSVRSRVSPGEQYWRARARDGKGRIISDYSAPQRIESPSVAPPALARNDMVRQPQAVEKITTRVEKVREPYQENGWWAWIGSGLNFTDYNQSVPGRYSVTTQNVKGPSQYFETGYIGKSGWGGLFTYKSTPGQVEFSDGTQIDRSTYSWRTLSGEATLRREAPLTFLGNPVVYGLRIGAQKHTTPFIFVDANAEAKLKDNDMTTASMGVLAEWGRKRWTYYWLARYQFPLSTQADGSNQFEITPTFAFDGSLGAAYNFTRLVKGGVFWYGQWHQYDFVYGDGNVTNAGSQSLFYSNIDFRLGIDF